MARPRKPDNFLQLNGAKRRNPGRFKNRGTPPADSRPFGRCPAFLTGLEKAAWREIVENALRATLQRSERIAVELAARLMAEIRAGGDMPAAKQALLAQMLGKLGQTPQGRSHVDIPPAPKSPNRFADS